MDIKSFLADRWTCTLNTLQPFLRRSVEVGVTIWGCWITTLAVKWSFTYAEKALGVAETTEIGVAAVIGAILGPLLTLTGYVVKKYLEHSKGTGKDDEAVK